MCPWWQPLINICSIVYKQPSQSYRAALFYPGHISFCNCVTCWCCHRLMAIMHNIATHTSSHTYSTCIHNAYIHTYTHMHTHIMYMCVCAYVYACVRVCICVCMCACVFVYMVYNYVCVCMWACIRVCVCVISTTMHIVVLSGINNL